MNYSKANHVVIGITGLGRRTVLGLLVGGALVAGCTEDPTRPADAVRSEVKGITLASWTATGYGDPTATEALNRIAATGANTLAILVTAYQSDARASQIRIDSQLTPQAATVTGLILAAQSLSTPLDIVIKLHVDVDDGTWRGLISPADFETWFDSYRAFVMSWAMIAEDFGAKSLIVGTELAGTINQEGSWRRLIADVREAFGGELIYAASWDEAPNVPFWDALDVVGVNFYAPVANRKQTNRFDLLSSWQPWLERIRRIHKQAERDVLLTEIGYRSVDGAGMHPYEFDRAAPGDVGEQADLYWAALEAVGNEEWIQGMYWWNWLANGDTDIQDYTPEDKPAEKELSDAWRR